MIKSLISVSVALAAAQPAFVAGQLAPAIYTETHAAESAMADVGGHRLFAQWAGEGPVTVVLESGQGTSSEVWSKVFPELARLTRTFAYDRAGLGKSEIGKTPRSAKQTLDELVTLLQKTGQRPPYLLVGWSMGGLYTRMFAHRYPGDVVGLLLVDPASENTYDWIVANKPDLPALEKQYRQEGGGTWEEWKALPQIFEASRSAWPLPQVPIAIITATDVPPQPHWWDQAYRHHFTSEQHALVARLGSAPVVVAQGSGHTVPKERPDLVLKEVVKLLASVRGRTRK